jgi:eukaryotic-like serine/threonine-protein kinase
MNRLKTGDRIGDWVVDHRLGEGAMAAVYRCHHAMSERMTSAVKLFHLEDPNAGQKWFTREVETLASLNHPGIVRILHPGVDNERGLLFLAMELVDGTTLRHVLAQGPLPADRARELFGVMALALAAAHARNIFHRDLKPSNIMLREDGRPVVLDFGIATHSDPSQQTTTAVGTPTYMAPELFQSDGGVDPGRADVYSLGVMFYEAVSGAKAFAAPTEVRGDARVMYVVHQKLQNTELDPGPRVDPELRAVVRAATVRDPSQRIPSMADFARRLQATEPERSLASLELRSAFSPSPPAEPSQSTPVEAPEPAADLFRWVLGGLLAALVLSLLLGGLTFLAITRL